MGIEDAGDLVLHIIFSKIGPESTIVFPPPRNPSGRFSVPSILIPSLLSIPMEILLLPSRQHINCGGSHLECTLGTSLNELDVVGNNLKLWLSLNFPESKATLRKGATEDDLQEFETALKLKLPLPTRLLYRFVDGQESSSNGSLGIIGGYSVYSHEVNVYLLPLKEVITETKETVRHLGMSSSLNLIAVAVSAVSSVKIFLLDCTNGQLYTGTSTRQMLPCVPDSLVRSVHDQQ